MLPWRSFRPALLVGSLICALVLLAILQYKWSGQVSEAEQLRMKSSLQIAADQFRQDFSREVLLAGTSLQADPDTVEAADWDTLAQSQSEWLASPAGAHLVSAVYLLVAADKPVVLRLDAAQAKYVPAAATGKFDEWISRLESPSDDRRPGPPRNSAWIMDGSGPYLIHFMTGRPSRGSRQPGLPPEQRRAGIQFIELNREYIAAKLLPELAAHHFSGPDGFVYQAQVYTAGSTKEVIYGSGVGLAANSSAPDIEADMIETRPRGGGPDRGPRDRQFGPRGDWQRREGRGMMFSMQRAFNTPLLVSDGVSPWKLSVRHRAGSVAAAVQTLRWRNLAVSFAILLLMAASMVTIVRNTQRAQRLAELQMEFVAGVSHEIRTPLAVISSAAENLTDGVVEGPGPVKQYGSLIRNESRRLSGMMEQILQFAAGQKRTPYKPVALDVEALVDGALGLSQTILNGRGFTVERTIEHGLPAVRGESGALTQCLQNLISNAAKYSGDSRWIGILASAEKGWVSISVEDRGLGIEKADLPHLFDAFYRAKAVRSAQIHGTGLGLNLARSFARDAGGDLIVESAAGEGSRFTLRLPADAPAASEPARLVGQTA